MDKETLKKFYFSTSSSFGSYKTVQDKRSTRGDADQRHPTMSDATISGINASVGSELGVVTGSTEVSPVRGTAAASRVDTSITSAAGGIGMHAVRTAQSRKKDKQREAGANQPVNVASPGYFKFLQQQQDLQRHHNRVEEAISNLESQRRNHQSELMKLRKQAQDLLQQIEDSTEWQLKSKYDVQQLIRDSNMALQPVELVDDVPPQMAGISDISKLLAKIKTDFKDTPQFANHALFVDQSIRRVGLLETVLQEGNLDATSLSRIPDTLLVQLENVCQLSTVDSLIAEYESAIDLSTFQAEEAQKKRAEAISEGEVHIAEKLCYDVLARHEEMLTNVVEKAKVLEKAIQENAVIEKVRGQYSAKAREEFERIKVRSAKLKARCEEDLKRMFALREKVEEVEAATAKKVRDEQAKSDLVLVENARKTELVFVKMDELEKELEVLERERHREIQKRTAEKDKDEHRRAEFAKFCHVVDEHTQPLERTIRNMDVAVHASDVLTELVEGGFKSIEDDLSERDKLLRDVKLEAHKQHVEVLRGMMLELGEICYKKERMVEETDKNIQQAHIQQELLAETFNPNAKKFGDVKKRLLLNRDELETDVEELKQRAAATLEQFKYSEDALSDSGVDYIHPVTEQEHHTLAIRVKMMEFRAMVVGVTQGQELLRRVEELKAEVNASKSEIESINASTTGTMSKAMPMIRAATKARRK